MAANWGRGAEKARAGLLGVPEEIPSHLWASSGLTSESGGWAWGCPWGQDEAPGTSGGLRTALPCCTHIHYLIITVAPRREYPHYPCCTDEETETGGSEKTCSSSHNSRGDSNSDPSSRPTDCSSPCRGAPDLPAAGVHSAILPGPPAGAGALRAVRHAEGETQHHEQLWGA